MATLLNCVLVAIFSSVCYSQSCDTYDVMKCLKSQLTLNQKVCKLLESENEKCLNEAEKRCPTFIRSTYIHLQHSLMLICQTRAPFPLGLQKNSQSRLKRQSARCDNSAIVSCSGSYRSDVLSHAADQAYICRRTRAYINNCLKANTEGCHSVYDALVHQARSAFERLEAICGNLCIQRGPCDTLNTGQPTIGPGPTQHTSEACARSGTAIASCTQTFTSDITSNLNDQDYICRRTRDYIQNCVKANTVECPEMYDQIVKQQRVTLTRLEGQCGNLCLSPGSCESTTTPGPTQYTADVCRRSTKAIASCTQTFMSDISSNSNDQDYICRRTRAYIQNCLKANTAECQEMYPQVVKQQRATLTRLEGQCGNLCVFGDCSSSSSKIYNKRTILLWLGLAFLLGMMY